MQKYLKSSKKNRLTWRKAPDIKKRVNHLIDTLDINWVNKKNIHTFRSQNSSSRAYARIWGLARIWQITLNKEPSYIIEVLSEKFDKLNENNKNKVLLHELAHIPKNFSGSLLPHIKKRGKRNFNDKVNSLVRKYDKLSK